MNSQGLRLGVRYNGHAVRRVGATPSPALRVASDRELPERTGVDDLNVTVQERDEISEVGQLRAAVGRHIDVRDGAAGVAVDQRGEGGRVQHEGRKQRSARRAAPLVRLEDDDGAGVSRPRRQHLRRQLARGDEGEGSIGAAEVALRCGLRPFRGYDPAKYTIATRDNLRGTQ